MVKDFIKPFLAILIVSLLAGYALQGQKFDPTIDLIPAQSSFVK
jgi:hypothetical protein